LNSTTKVRFFYCFAMKFYTQNVDNIEHFSEYFVKT